MTARVAVLASGGGTNLQALLDHFSDGDTARVALVISDRKDAGALDRARGAGVPAHVIPVAGRPVAAATADMIDALESEHIDIIALAGYLRLVPPEVTRRFAFRVLNIHPALLPAFGGKGMYGRRVHEAVLEAGCRVTGPTVHFVNERYDEGRILAQWPVPVLEDDTARSLAGRVLRAEHMLYPVAVEWLAGVLDRARSEDDGHDHASAVEAALAAPLGDTAAFRLAEEDAPDRRGVRRMFGLD